MTKDLELKLYEKIEKLEKALAIAREALALMTEGEGPDHKVYMQMSGSALRKIKGILK